MILLAASVLLLGVIAWLLDRFAAVDGETRAAKATRMLLWAFASVVVVQAMLGAVGLLTPVATLLALAAVAAALSAPALRRPTAAPSAPERLSAVAVMLAAMLSATFLLGLWRGLDKTTFLYDTLSYHLHVPATWMHDRRITIVPAVFGDPSPAYAPANGELWFLLLMAPLRSDYLAGVGQLPFAALAAAAIATAVRESGATRSAGIAAALAFLLIPEVGTQMANAMTDLAFAACLLSALPFVLRMTHAERPRRGDLLTVVTAVGLAAGTKYAAAALALPFAVLAGATWLRRRPVDVPGAALALGVLLVTGGFWYVRNAVVTGNPTYPVSVPGLQLPALYGGVEMRRWDYHLPVTNLGALGSMLNGAGIGFSLALAAAIVLMWFRDARKDAVPTKPNVARRDVNTLMLATLIAIFWLVVPYQESRFLFVVFGVGAVLMGQAARGRSPASVALAGALIWALIDWEGAERIVLLLVAGVAGAIFAERGRARRIWTRRHVIAAAAIGAAALYASIAAGAADFARRDPGYSVGDETAADWVWFRANVHNARVAYTGTNVAFPLSGEGLANDVRYVNVAGGPSDRLHDFGPPGDGTAEPAPYRRGARADVWLANLRAARTEVLFVASLYPGVRRNIAADADSFPVERAWADARPDTFYLLHASPTARVYSVTRR